jgi:hypothetical protein
MSTNDLALIKKRIFYIKNLINRRKLLSVIPKRITYLKKLIEPKSDELNTNQEINIIPTQDNNSKTISSDDDGCEIKENPKRYPIASYNDECAYDDGSSSIKKKIIAIHMTTNRD